MANEPKNQAEKSSEESSLKPAVAKSTASAGKSECFIIMPIADPDGYEKGHFNRVYKDIFMPACDKAGFVPVRADEVGETNLIHLDILQKLLDSPMALCDLSNRNPNVLFELGLRQAFDKPVTLVQETGTPAIFDIAPLRYVNYRQALLYRQVLEDQNQIADALKMTFEKHGESKSINSIVKLLSLTQPANFVEISDVDRDPMLQLIRAEIAGLRQEVLEVKTNSTSFRISPTELQPSAPSLFSSGTVTMSHWNRSEALKNLRKEWPNVIMQANALLTTDVAILLENSNPIKWDNDGIEVRIVTQDIPSTETRKELESALKTRLQKPVSISYEGVIGG